MSKHATVWFRHPEGGIELEMCGGVWPDDTDPDEVLLCMERTISAKGCNPPENPRVVWVPEGERCICGHVDDDNEEG